LFSIFIIVQAIRFAGLYFLSLFDLIMTGILFTS
jgi:hypothetical protein